MNMEDKKLTKEEKLIYALDLLENTSDNVQRRQELKDLKDKLILEKEEKKELHKNR